MVETNLANCLSNVRTFFFSFVVPDETDRGYESISLKYFCCGGFEILTVLVEVLCRPLQCRFCTHLGQRAGVEETEEQAQRHRGKEQSKILAAHPAPMGTVKDVLLVHD